MALLRDFAPELLLPAAATNFPQYISSMAGGAYRSALAFDTTVSEKCRTVAFEMPEFTGALTLKIRFAIAATTGNVQFRAQVEAITAGDALNTNTSTSFDTANSSGAIAVNGSTFVESTLSITLTNADSVAVGDTVTIAIDRDVTVASDAAGDCFVYLAALHDAR